MKAFKFVWLLSGLSCITGGFAQIPSTTWRALIVYTNTIDSIYHGNWYEHAFATTFNEINLVYENSGLETRGQIAGVLWDKSYARHSDHPDTGVMADIQFNRGGLSKWIARLDEYAADYLILAHRNYAYPPGTGGAAHYFTSGYSTTAGYAGIWVQNWAGTVWAHEVGHTYNLGHCNGVRQTFDAMGNPVDTLAVSGFYTVMEYRGYSECPNSGDYNMVDEPYMTRTWRFSSPNLTWEHPHTNATHTLSTAIHQNSVDLMPTYETAILAFGNTPVNLTLADTMSLEEWNYANFIASGKVTIEPGFKVDRAKMRITVGPNVMAKRGAGKNDRFLSEKGPEPSQMGAVRNFFARYEPGSKNLRVSFQSSPGKVALAIYDTKGILRQKVGEFETSGESFSRAISLQGLPKGRYFLKTTVASQKIFKPFTVH